MRGLTLGGLALGTALAATATARAQTATVSTMAELRTAINNSSITTININPGTYLLTSSGSGQLLVERNLTITNTGGGRVVIDGNNASRVFAVNGATVTMTGLTITRGNGNGGSEGGGIYANSATLQLIQSTLSGNATTGSKDGGGVWANSTALQLINSTVSGNTAAGAQGGGVYANGGSALMSNSTIASNSAGTGGGISRNGTTLTLRNSIIADNTGGQITGSGTITSNGKNLVEGGCSGCSGSDLTADPTLGALANNGGNSYTHSLLAGSPALNAASNTDAQPTDQRGRTRPQGATADIGAFESGADLAVGKTVSDPTPPELAAISYTVTVTGAGPDAATSVVIGDLLPAGVTFQSYTATQGTYTSATGVWSVGTVASGTTATLTLTVTVNAGTAGSTITNTASVSALGQAESSTANNSASAVITVQVAASAAVTPDGGQALERLPSNATTYSVTFSVENTGGATDSFDLLASSPGAVVIAIVSVAGVPGDSMRTGGLAVGVPLSVDVVYTVADVPAGTLDTLWLQARSVTQPTAADDGSADLTVIRPALTIAKQAFRDDQVTPVGAGAVTPGEYLQYRVTVTNTGTAPATTVEVEDVLPAELSFVSAAGDAPGWTFTPAGAQVDAALAGSLAVGASRYFWVRARVN